AALKEIPLVPFFDQSIIGLKNDTEGSAYNWSVYAFDKSAGVSTGNEVFQNAFSPTLHPGADSVSCAYLH
ncbi:MAG: hypothetical protein ABIP39_16875, partial [Polyangiaceae bacterium]